MTQEELANLSPEERARLDAAEQEALKTLKHALHDGGRYPRRHMRFAFYAFMCVLALGVVMWLLLFLLGVVKLTG